MAGLVAGAIVIAAVYSGNLALWTDGETSDLNFVGAEQFCQSREEALAKTEGKMQVKEPTYIPEDYMLVCADGSPEVLLLFYGDGRILEREKANRNDLIDNGAILIATKRFDAETDDAYGIKDRDSEIRQMFDGPNKQLETRLTEINGNLAAVREMCQDCGQSFITQEDGKTVQMGTYALPSIIAFYDGDQMYRLEAYQPSEELEKIANSLA